MEKYHVSNVITIIQNYGTAAWMVRRIQGRNPTLTKQPRVRGAENTETVAPNPCSTWELGCVCVVVGRRVGWMLEKTVVCSRTPSLGVEPMH